MKSLLITFFGTHSKESKKFMMLSILRKAYIRCAGIPLYTKPHSDLSCHEEKAQNVNPTIVFNQVDASIDRTTAINTNSERKPQRVNLGGISTYFVPREANESYHTLKG